MIIKREDTFSYWVDDIEVSRTFESEIENIDKYRCYIEEDQNLLEKIPENKDGFLTREFADFKSFEQIQSAVLQFLIDQFELDLDTFNLEENLLGLDDDHFKEKVQHIYKGIGFDSLPISSLDLEEWASDIVKQKLCLNYFETKPHLSIRIVRPDRTDYNPPHRDIYIKRLRNCLNSFMPIYGVNKLSSLSLLKGSHLWNESRTERTKLNPIIDGISYNVPALLRMQNGEKLKLIRPNVNDGEIMLFSPYLVHGGAINLSKKTRISLEFRFKKLY